MSDRRTEIKLLGCWVASWAAGIGTLVLGLKPTYGIDLSGEYFVFIFSLAIGAAMGAWQLVVHLWR